MGLLDNIKSAVSVAQKLKDRKLIEHLMNLQMSVLEYQERLHNLEAENKALKEKLTVKESLVVEHGVYFSKTGDKTDGPFCTRCWDSDDKLLRLRVLESGTATCPQCKSSFDYQCETLKGFHPRRGHRV